MGERCVRCGAATKVERALLTVHGEGCEASRFLLWLRSRPNLAERTLLVLLDHERS